jgi:hypothetical protein
MNAIKTKSAPTAITGNIMGRKAIISMSLRSFNP